MKDIEQNVEILKPKTVRDQRLDTLELNWKNNVIKAFHLQRQMLYI